jgi:ketosteroid isomerase-like protein
MLPLMDQAQRMRDIWNALSQGDVGPLEAALEPDARWRAVEDGPWNCTNRAEILDVMARNLADGRLSGRIESALEVGDRVMVGFRPDNEDGWPLDNGIRHVVVSLAGDRITELKGCASREIALAYAQR